MSIITWKVRAAHFHGNWQNFKPARGLISAANQYISPVLTMLDLFAEDQSTCDAQFWKVLHFQHFADGALQAAALQVAVFAAGLRPGLCTNHWG